MKVIKNQNLSENQQKAYLNSDLLQEVQSHYHTTELFMKYQNAYLDKPYKDYSFTVFHGKEPIISVNIMTLAGE